MTATPRIFQNSFKKKASDSGVEVVSMDHEAVFGPVLHKLSFGEAIEQDLLTDYQVVVVGIDNPSYSSMITERTLVKTDTDIQSDAQSFASHIGLAKAIKNYDLTRVISFHSRVSSARDFANKLPEVIDWMPRETKPDGELLTDHVSGAMPTNERNKNLQALGNITDEQRYILSNARCLSEGVDVPALDGVAFIDPRNSEIDIVQAVGRAIRLSKGKAIGSIVIPVFIEDHEDPDEVLNSSPFKKVWAVVNALRSHDESLGEELDQLRQAIGKRGTVGKSDKIVFDLPTTITRQFETALKTKIIESTTASWEFWFGLLENYKEKHGDCLVKIHYQTESRYKLGQWAAAQRSKKHSINHDYIERLNNLGFVWSVNNEQWEHGFEKLLEFKNQYGHCLVKIDEVFSGFHLGSWVARQRVPRIKRRLSTEQIERLNQLQFVWNVSKVKWEQGYHELENYYKINGHTKVLKRFKTETGFNLGTWLSTQTQNTNLDEDYVRRLKELGVVFDKFEQQWQEGYNELMIFKDQNGNCAVPMRYKSPSGFSLGSWVGTQRVKGKSINDDRTNRLNQAGFIWDILDQKWDIAVNELKQFKEKHKDCLVPHNYKSEAGFVLGRWVSRNRKNFKLGTLSPERVKQLDEMGFTWQLK
jgi:hypothetical protein